MDHHGLANPRLANAFIARCIASSGREPSLNKTAARLREMGLPVAQETLASLLRYYEESYLVFNLRELFCSLSDNLRAPSKLYATDPGLLAAYSPCPRAISDNGWRPPSSTR